MDKEQALTLLRAGYGDELRRAAYQFTAPLFWADPATPRPLFNNGSVFFLDCGDGPFAVTADHVYAAYLARKEQAPGLVCQIGRLRFKPEDRIIDRDQRLDVATFRIGEVEVERTAKWLHRPSSWPPVPPEEGRGVFLAGFARTLRDEKEEAVSAASHCS